MSRTAYGISWLYGELRIARYHRGQRVEYFESSDLIESQPDLVRALEEAAGQINMGAGGGVSVVHEHDLHTHEFLDVPAMKRRDLEKYLARRVDKQKAFEDDASWCYHGAKHRDGSEGVLLHLLPKRIVETTVSTLSNTGLQPKRYVPLTEIISSYLPEISDTADELVVAIAMFRARTELVIALTSGEVLLVRELNYGMGDDASDRLVTDINRTLRYTRQQIGRPVVRGIVLGDTPPDMFAKMADAIEVPISLDPQSVDHFFWASQATRLPRRLSANFVSVFAQRNITRAVFARAAAMVVLLVLMTAGGITALVSALVSHKAEELQQTLSRIHTLEGEIEEARDALTQGMEQQEQLERLRANTFNLPPLFLRHLSDLTPPSLTLRQVSVEKRPGGWSVELSGAMDQGLPDTAAVLDAFELRLSEPPWRMTLSRSWKAVWLGQLQAGAAVHGENLQFQIAGQL